MEATLGAARAGATTGEWAGTLREVFGEFRAPTGVSGAVGVAEAGPGAHRGARAGPATGEELGGRLRLLVGKPGPGRPLQRCRAGRGAGARRRVRGGLPGDPADPEQIVAAAVAEDVHCVGLSILSGSHMELVPDVLEAMKEAGLDDVPVIVGGIIPTRDAALLKELGVAEVFTPKDFSLTEAMAGIVRAIRERTNWSRNGSGHSGLDAPVTPCCGARAP